MSFTTILAVGFAIMILSAFLLLVVSFWKYGRKDPVDGLMHLMGVGVIFLCGGLLMKFVGIGERLCSF